MERGVGFYLDSGFNWAYPRGVDKAFENLVSYMGNITLAQFIELAQAVEKESHNNRCRRQFRERFRILKTLPTPIIRHVLLHPVWIYWVRSTRQIIQAKILQKEIPQQWRRHLNPSESSYEGFLEESLKLFGHLVLAAFAHANQEIEIEIEITIPDDQFLCLPGTGITIGLGEFISSVGRQVVMAGVKEISEGGKILFLRSKANNSKEFALHLSRLNENQLSRSNQLTNHRLKEIAIGKHRCEIDNRDPRIIDNWVWFDVFPGKPMVRVARDSQISSWQRTLNSAFSILEDSCPSLADELASIWRTVIPVEIKRSNQSVSCSSRDFWGAIQISPHPGIALPEVLVHEYRHNILNALLEADPIIDELCTREPIFYSPWRSDSRPLVGLLHGIYSFIEVVDFNFNYLKKNKGGDSQLKFAETRIIINLCRLKLALSELEKFARFTSFGGDFFQGLVKRVEHFDKATTGMNPSLMLTQTRKVTRQYSDWRRPKTV